VVNRIYNLFKEDKTLQKDIKFIGVAISSPEEIAAYQTNFKIEFPQFSDANKDLQKKLKIDAVPYAVVLDKKGKLLMSHSGLIDNFDAYVGEIKQHLKAAK
jgi:thioredoxin-related protein